MRFSGATTGMLGLKSLLRQREGVEVQECCAQKVGIDVRRHFKSLMSHLAKAFPRYLAGKVAVVN
jgi:hypothetical protein